MSHNLPMIKNAEIALTTAAIGYTTIVQAAAQHPDWLHETYIGAGEHLQHTALEYAASLGSVDAAERAELLALRQFREGVIALRGELATGGVTKTGERVDTGLAVETIDALMVRCAP